MKLKTIAIRMGETIPTVQFANVRPEVEVAVECVEGDTVDAVVAYARQIASVALAELRDEMLGIRAKPQAVTQPPKVLAPLQNTPQQAAGTWPVAPPPPPQQAAGIPKVDPVTF